MFKRLAVELETTEDDTWTRSFYVSAYKKSSSVVSDLGDMCYYWTLSKQYRKQGNVKTAMWFEDIVDNYYESLPKELRW